MGIQAHKVARRTVHQYFRDAEEPHFGDAEAKVFEESEEQCTKARDTVNEVEVSKRNHIKSRMLTGKLINEHMHKIDKMQEEGLISRKGAQTIAHHLQEMYRGVGNAETKRFSDCTRPKWFLSLRECTSPHGDGVARLSLSCCVVRLPGVLPSCV